MSYVTYLKIKPEIILLPNNAEIKRGRKVRISDGTTTLNFQK